VLSLWLHAWEKLDGRRVRTGFHKHFEKVHGWRSKRFQQGANPRETKESSMSAKFGFGFLFDFLFMFLPEAAWSV
jgi:hypothetical protein